ncbi:facilitated trehalose transporter Tret1-like [Diorhabda sublineata]|uniref:facilitated trehalose transporter Tret1-like n=1 Tax=Diorhabda sublineata TaxID=1163346 RepID=UPI0024E122B2|nr:facilitated trehalose transporter Tret1-like [Diorhabda sublineata]
MISTHESLEIPGHPNTKSRNTHIFLYFTAITADLLLVSFGSGLAWTSPVLPKLHSNDSTINPLGQPITTMQTALIAFIPLSAGSLTHLFWAILLDKIGRKLTMIIIATNASCGLLGIAFASNIYLYYICLCIFGCSLSGDVVAVVVYNNEIADDINRGRLGCLAALSVPSGMLFSYIFGSVTSFKVFTLICAGPSFLFLLASPFLVDCPTFLITKHKRFEAYRALKKLRVTEFQESLIWEYEKIKNTVIEGRTVRGNKYCTRAFIRAILQSLLSLFVQQLSGILVVNYYVASIFNESGFGLSGDCLGILVGVVQIVTYIIILILIQRIGKRRLILVSSLFCSISMFFLGLYFYLSHIKSPIFDRIHWIAIVFVIFYLISYGMGLGAIPMGLVGEFFCENTRAIGSALVFTVSDSLMALIVFSFPIVSETYGIYINFWFHCIGSLVGCVGLFFFFVETEGKSLLEVQNIMKNN